MFSQHKRLLRLLSPIGGGDCVVTSFHGAEQISDVYRFDVTLLSTTRIAHEKIIGTDIAVQIVRENAARWFHGVIAAIVENGTSANNIWQYRCEMVPALALLEVAAHNRIFENFSVVDIVTSIIRACGQRLDTSRLRTYSSRETCTQFGETDLAFVNRILAEEGIAYFFRQQENGCVCVLVDSASGFDELTEKIATYTGMARGSCEYRDVITSWRPYFRFATEQLTSIDYSEYATAPVRVDASRELGAHTACTSRMEYYGRHYFQRSSDAARDIDLDARSTQTERWLAALQQDAGGVSGAGTVAGFSAGMRGQVTGVNGSEKTCFLLTRVVHDVADGNDSSSHYSNTFAGVLGDRGYVPPQIWPRPRIYGVHSAKVLSVRDPQSTGANAEVKVAFAWHPTQASCWARVTQLHAGNRFGSYFMPEPGQEVLVQFLNADPDRPVVVGALYNRDHALPPYSATQSGIRTRSTNFNELRFDDREGFEQLYMEAGRDHHYVINHDQTGDISNNRYTTIQQGNDVTRVCSGNQTTDVAGEVTIRANGRITLQVGGSSLIIDATGISLNGTMVILQANAQVEVSAGAVASISGGVVNIN